MEPTKEQRKRDLENRRLALERELASADEHRDALHQATVYHNLGGVQVALEDWEAALESYEAAAQLVPGDAEVVERLTPVLSAADTARRLNQHDRATKHYVQAHLLLQQADNQPGFSRSEAETILRRVRKVAGDEFEACLDQALERLPEEQRDKLDRDQLLSGQSVGDSG